MPPIVRVPRPRKRAAIVGKAASGAVRDQLLDVIVPNAGAWPLRSFHAALAAVDEAPLDILVVGDSIGEGFGVDALGDRWIERFVARLRARWQPAGVTGGEAYIAAYYGPASGSDIFPSFSYTGTATRDINGGLGRKRKKLAPGTATRTFTGTSAWVIYSTDPTSGDFTVTVDGGVPATVTAHGASGTCGHVYDTGPLAPGEHEIVISTSNVLYLEGMKAFNGDEAAGIRLWDGCFSGRTAHYYVLEDLKWFADVAMIPNLKLVILEFGTNDQHVYTVADFTVHMAALKQFIINQRTPSGSPVAADVPSFVFVIPPVDEWTSNTVTYPDSDWIAAFHDMAIADPTIAVFDMTQRFGFGGTGASSALSAGLMLADRDHPTALGHRVWANAFASFVEP